MRASLPSRLSNLDLLRLITATAVIFGHAYALNKVREPGFLGDTVGYLRVKVFFVLSGALLARSWIRDPSFGRYFARRALRILPGLALVVLFCAFVLGPILTTLPLGEYFTHPGTLRYLRNILLNITYALPGVFTENPHPHAVNGSLWSLSVEVLMYVMLPVVLWVGQRTRSLKPLVWGVTLFLCAWSLNWTYLNRPETAPVFYGMSLRSIVHVAPFFWLGVVFGLHGWHNKLSLQVAIAAVVLVAFFTPTGIILGALTCVLIPYVVLALGFAKEPVFAGVSGYGDYAYGVYLWGFPVQQLLIHLWGGPMEPWLNFSLTVPVSLLLAVASWHGVEKWFQRFRPETPARKVSEVASLPVIPLGTKSADTAEAVRLKTGGVQS